MLSGRQTIPQPRVAFAAYDSAAIGGLTRGERAEYDMLRGDERRRDWLAGRSAAKRAVAAQHGSLDSRNVELIGRVRAAPRCFACRGRDRIELAINVSIAHRDGIALAAASQHGVRIGVDIDRDGMARDFARYFAAPRETEALDVIGASALWVLKEAAWKALGLGDAVPFTALTMCFSRATGLSGVLLDEVFIPARAQLCRHPDQLISATVSVAQYIQ
jgi:phosphopantetheinyl transferase